MESQGGEDTQGFNLWVRSYLEMTLEQVVSYALGEGTEGKW